MFLFFSLSHIILKSVGINVGVCTAHLLLSVCSCIPSGNEVSICSCRDVLIDFVESKKWI